MGKFWVMRQKTSNLCRVQEDMEAPLGEKFKGPYDTREEAGVVIVSRA